MYATPASAAIDLSIGGSAKVTASMHDGCGVNDAATSIDETIGAVAAVNTATGRTYVDADAAGSATALEGPDFSCAGGADEDHPVWGFEKKLNYVASGTLANGLGVTFKDEFRLHDIDFKEGSFELALDGAFGTLTFMDGVDSAVKAAQVNAESDVSVTGRDLGGHSWATAGADGFGLLYQAPSMGSVDLFISYAPNSSNTGLSTSAYQDTIGFGGSFSADMITISAGFETATNNTNAAAADKCTANAAAGADLQTVAEAVAAESPANDFARIADQLLGTESCGDMSVMALGAVFNAGDIVVNAGYSKKDTDEADKTTWNVGADTTVGAYSLGVNYVNSKNDFLYGLGDEQTVIGVSLATALGDGVDLGFDFSTNKYDSWSKLAAHDTNNYLAEASLSVSF
jgi:hypothetical protein